MPKRAQGTESSAQALAASARYFTDLPEELAAELRKHARRVVVRKGALVHQKGDLADGLYQLTLGAIRVSTTSADGRELVLTDLKPGAFFGEISLFDHLPRTHDARATEKSELLHVPAARFDQLLAERPALAGHFLRALSAKLRLCFAVIEGMGMQSVSQRLVLRLLWLMEQRAEPRTRVHTAAVELGAISQSDLASMVGATRQSINKELQALQRAGAIQLNGRSLTLLDLAALRAITGI